LYSIQTAAIVQKELRLGVGLISFLFDIQCILIKYILYDLRTIQLLMRKTFSMYIIPKLRAIMKIMSLRSKTHVTLLSRCYVHGGFNNHIPTTISQAYYRNFLRHIHVELFYFYFACSTSSLQMMKDIGGIVWN